MILMGGRFMGLYVFVPLDKRPAVSAEELFKLLGCDFAAWKFGPLGITWHGTETLSDHICMRVSFLYSQFTNALFEAHGLSKDIPLEQDTMLPLAFAIRNGAFRVGAEVAFLETRNYMMETAVQDHYWAEVLLRDATGLAMSWFSLLYMDDAFVKDWNPGPIALDRDELPGPPGRTLFAGRGSSRWF